MNLPKNNNGLIDLENRHPSMSVNSPKNTCQMLPKIESGNKILEFINNIEFSDEIKPKLED